MIWPIQLPRCSSTLPVLALLLALALIGGPGSAVFAASTDPLEQVPVPEVTIPETSQAINVDGRIGQSEWASARRITLPLALLEETRSSANLSGTAYLAWNPNWLYLGFRVNDNSLIFTKGTDERTLWENDSIEVWLNRLWLTAGLTKEGKARLDAVDLGRWYRPDTSGSQVAVVKDRSGYTVEMALPASLVEVATGRALSDGLKLRLALNANDADTADYKPVQARLRFPVQAAWNTDDSFAIATLIGRGEARS